MILVAMAGTDLALLAAMRRRAMIDASTWGAGVLLVLCYDFAAYFTILAFRHALRSAPDERPSPAAIGVAIVVLGTCAGLAIVGMAMILSWPAVE